MVARRLRDDRAANDPRFVETGKLTREAADERAACSAALVALWRHVHDRTAFDVHNPFSSLGASWFQLSRDLDATLIAAEARAKAAPKDQVRRDIADCVATMRRQLDPVGCGLPHIAFVHDFNLWSRARRWPQREAA